MNRLGVGLVVYTLNQQDADAINVRRHDAAMYRSMNPRVHAGAEGATGFVAHVGNHAAEGQQFPAVIVRDWNASVNLQVFLDGNDIYWATSRSEGTKPGEWSRNGSQEVG